MVQSGGTFLRRMINLSTTVSEPHHHIRINQCFRSDLAWWATFLPGWNGTSMMADVQRSIPQEVITLDASSWGCGAFGAQRCWFQLQWPPSWDRVHITAKELVPVVMSVALWGHGWQGTTVLCRCDNAAIVSIVNSGRSTNGLAMHLMLTLFFYTAVFQLVVVAEHVAGRDNEAADAISCDRVPNFLSLIPQASPEATRVPANLVDLLVTNQPDWTSSEWKTLFVSTLRRGWHHPLNSRIDRGSSATSSTAQR